MTGDTVESIREGLASDDVEVRRETIKSAFEEREEWTELEPLVPDLIEALEGDPFVREGAARAIARIGSLDESQREALADRLAGDDRATAYYAIDALHGVSEDDPEAVAPAAPAVIDFLEVRDGLEGETPESWLADGPVDEHDAPATMRAHGKRRLQAIELLGRVAETDSGALAGEVDTLVTISGRGDHPQIRTDALALLATVAEEEPETFDGEIEPIAALLADDEDDVRANAAFLLAILAEDQPEAVADAAAPRGEAIKGMIESDDDVATNAAVGLVAYVAEERPEAVEPMQESVLSLLDHDVESVRGNAIWTLSYLESEEIADRLATVAEDDPSEDIREHAAAVIDDRSAE